MHHDKPEGATRAQRLSGLAPIVSSNTRLLVLGSFPGAASLVRQQYYAHPQNQFWKILQAILPSSPRGICLDSYENKSNWLLEQSLGVWDVYASCERKGSLDAAIRNAEVNDFSGLAQRWPSGARRWRLPGCCERGSSDDRAALERLLVPLCQATQRTRQ